MTRHRPPARLALAATAAAALAASLLAGAVGGTVGGAAAGAPAAAPGEPTVSLTGSAGEMWASRNGSYGDLGVRIATDGGRVELRTRRSGWDRKPETHYFPGGWTEGSTSWEDGVAVPRTMMRGFDRLRGLVDVVVRRADGKGPKVEKTIDGCLNGYEPLRLGPGSPADPYYPGGCPWNPFTVGSVQGIEAGYASAVSEWMRLPVGEGRYTVRASLGSAWAELLGVDAADRSVTYPMTISGGDDEEGWFSLRELQAERRAERAVPPAAPGSRPAPMRSSGGMADMDGMAHSAATLPCGYEPGADDPLPDLESLPAFGIESNGQNLAFSATVWNSGDSPLVVDGFRRDGQELMDAYQYFYTRDADGDLSYEPGAYCGVGGMHWHAAKSHNHWHFLDFARYRLLSVKEPGKVVRSTKQSFCLANTDAVDYTRPGADWRPEGTDLSSACGSRSARSLRQVLSAGSGDTYGQYRAGQAFRLKGLPNGWYDISVEANPRDLLHEADEDPTKDVALRRVWIGTKADGSRTVKVPPIGLVCGQMGSTCD